MSRPKGPDRVNVTLRRDLHERLRSEATDRVLGLTILLDRAVEDFLDRLIPVDELRQTIALNRKRSMPYALGGNDE